MVNTQSRLDNNDDGDASSFGYVQHASDEDGFRFPRLVMRISPKETDVKFYYHSDPTRPVYTVPLNHREDTIPIYKVQQGSVNSVKNSKVGSISFEYYPTCCVVAIDINPKGVVFVKTAVAAVAFEETFRSLFFGLLGMGPTFHKQTVLYSYEDDDDGSRRDAEDHRKSLMESILLGMMLLVDQKHQLGKFKAASTGNCLKITCKPKIKYRYNYQYEGNEDFKAPALGTKILRVHKTSATDYDITCSPSFTNELLAVAIAFGGRRYHKTRSSAIFWVRFALILAVAVPMALSIKQWCAVIF